MKETFCLVELTLKSLSNTPHYQWSQLQNTKAFIIQGKCLGGIQKQTRSTSPFFTI